MYILQLYLTLLCSRYNMKHCTSNFVSLNFVSLNKIEFDFVICLFVPVGLVGWLSNISFGHLLANNKAKYFDWRGLVNKDSTRRTLT